MTDGVGLGWVWTGEGLLLQEGGDVLVEEGFVGGAGTRAGGVAPQRGDGQESAVRDELRLVLRVANGEVEVGGGGHVEDGRLDGAEGLLEIAVEAVSGADVVLL